MRMLATLAAIGAAGAPARADDGHLPLLEGELRFGYGLSMGGGGGKMVTRPTPLNVIATAAIAVRDQPRIYGYGGLAAETLDRNAVGAVAGVRVVPAVSRLRLAAGAAWWFAPYTMYGATASVGACWRRSLGVCGDLQLATYFAGSDLASGHTVTQAQAMVGVVFDAL